jgi:hypothetical protein
MATHTKERLTYKREMTLEDIKGLKFQNKTNLIKNETLMRQGVDFNFFGNGSMNPTDIDMLCTFNNKFLILGEIKQRGKDIPEGQLTVIYDLITGWMDKNELVRERNKNLELTKLYYKAIGKPFNVLDFIPDVDPGRKAIAFKLVHDTPPTEPFIKLVDCEVEAYFMDGKWHEPKIKNRNFLEVFMELGAAWGIDKITKQY